jgi:hypothetical protein
MKRYAWLFILFFCFGLYTTEAQNWKITDSDNTVILIGEGWIKTLPGSEGLQEGTSDEYSDEMYGEDEDEDNTITMYNPGKKLLVIINDAEQTYAEGTLQEYCDALRSMRQGVDASMLEQLIADQKAMPAVKISVTREKGEPILGYSTFKYTIESDNGFYEQKWMSTDPELNEIVRKYGEMIQFISEIVACSVPDASFLKSDPEFSDEYKEVQASGFELMSFSYDSEGNETANEVVSIEKDIVPTSEFKIPEGYSKRSFREFMISM